MKYETFHNWILENLEEGKTILEFGSGPGTTRFAEKFNVLSIEHDTKYMNVEPRATYVHAPIAQYDSYQWYDKEIVRGFIKEHKYDLILVDGPVGYIGRAGMKSVLDILQAENIPVIFDDVNRPAELLLMKEVAAILKRDYEIFVGINRSFAVLK